MDPRSLRVRCAVHATGQMLMIGGEVAHGSGGIMTSRLDSDLLSTLNYGAHSHSQHHGVKSQSSMKKRIAGWRESGSKTRSKLQAQSRVASWNVIYLAVRYFQCCRSEDCLGLLQQEANTLKIESSFSAIFRSTGPSRLRNDSSCSRELDGRLGEPSPNKCRFHVPKGQHLSLGAE